MSSLNSPRTISVKRKRGDVPVDALTIEPRTNKRVLTDTGFIFRRVLSSSVPTPPPPRELTSQPPTPRRFQFAKSTGDFFLVEKVEKKEQRTLDNTPSSARNALAATPERPLEKSSTPRKLPRASEAEKKFRAETWNNVAPRDAKTLGETEPSEALIRELERLSEEIEQKETVTVTPVRKNLNYSKYKPRAPPKRIKDRQPDQASVPKPDAMDVEMEDYVYDTYVREVIMDDADGIATDPKANVGIIELGDEDEELWEAWAQEDGSDREFDTDDEDENAENFYGADYPEDEVESDDEYGLDPYQYYKGSDEEEYDAEGAAWSDDEVDDLRYPWR